ncbi:MAG: hypothetical protein ABI834_07750 [Ginsengibacter sp.]
MKHTVLLALLLSLWLFSFTQVSAGQEKLDLPGDNLNLYAVLKIFQESETLEGFEKSLNDENNKINNLDLDGDNKTDYIKVVDNKDGDVHNIALRISVNKNEDQDVAVFVVQKDKDGQVQIQLIGDEDLYGKDYIVEPNYETTDNSSGTPNPGYIPSPATELNQEIEVQPTSPSQIATWNVIRFIYVPNYIVWRSPWRWGYYPSYWRPWNPSYWHYYYGYHYHWDYYYYGHYRRWKYYRYPSWRDYYYRPGFRSTSVFVHARFKRGDYRKTYSRPDLAKQGSAIFKKDFPKAPSVNDKLPSFDKAGRPVHPKPVTKPITTQPVTRPVIKPVTTNPAIPITKPITRPVIKPITKPVVTEPVTRPVTKPITTNPVTRPVTRPGNSHITRPAIKPAITKHKTRPADSKTVPIDKRLR